MSACAISGCTATVNHSHRMDGNLVTWNPVAIFDTPDPVNHPPHYRWLPVEVIEITERLNFCLGNVIKYVLRADHKGRPIEDLKKARWYLDREIARREAAGE